jgi:tetraacyldisaccharide 4'-kinase
MLGFITKIRNNLYDRGIFKSSAFDFPIINVGNLAVGGSGKTPHVEYLIQLLKDEFKVATLSRGYGRNTRGYREVQLNDRASESGDEPLQIKQHFPDIRVFVNESRVEGVTKLLFDVPETDVILLDDAFQHRAIKPGLNILLTDYARIFTDDKMMPAGRLREHPRGAARADMVVITKCPLDLEESEKEQIRQKVAAYTPAPVFFSGVKYHDYLVPVFDNVGNNSPEHNNIVLISGIARSQGLEDYVKLKFQPQEFEHFNFRDHYHFRPSDLKRIAEKFNTFVPPKIMICTDKDAVRLKEVAQGSDFAKLPLYRLPIEVQFLGNDSKEFDKKIKDYVRQNKANFEIHQEQN